MSLPKKDQKLIHARVADALTKVSTTPTIKYERIIPAERAKPSAGLALVLHETFTARALFAPAT